MGSIDDELTGSEKKSAVRRNDSANSEAASTMVGSSRTRKALASGGLFFEDPDGTRLEI